MIGRLGQSMHLVIMNDIDAEELKKPSLHVEMPVWADAKDLLEKLESRLNEKLADGEVLFKGDEWRTGL